ERNINAWRPLAHRLAGSGRRHALAWREADALRVPEALAVFPQPELNRDLYLWLTAMASQSAACPEGDWLHSNQQLILRTLAAYPGLNDTYYRLAQQLVELRRTRRLPPAQSARESALQCALLSPGSQPALPAAPGEPSPVPLSLYPLPDAAPRLAGEPNDDEDPPATSDPGRVRQSRHRKQSDYVVVYQNRQALLISRPQSMLSWSGCGRVDRCEDDSDDEDRDS